MPSPTFADFGFSAAVLEALTRKGLRGTDPHPGPRHTATAQRERPPRRPRAHRHRQDGRLRPAAGREAQRRPAPRCAPSSSYRPASWPCRSPARLPASSPGPAPRIATVYGGASMSEQLRRLSRGVDIVVGTPGRVLDHIDRKTLDLSGLEWLVLDEADEMLDMGFIEDIEKVMDAVQPGAPRRAVLRHHAARHHAHRPGAPRHLRDRGGHDQPGAGRPDRPDMAGGARARQARGPLPHRRLGGRVLRPRVLPHQDRDGRGGQGPGGARLRGRGPARRRVPGHARAHPWPLPRARRR